MRSLFAFLWKYQFTVVFLILEGIALSLLFNSYAYHRSMLFNAVGSVTGNIYQISANITGYFELGEENEQLLDENRKLRNELLGIFRQSDTSSTLYDSLFEFIPARVISNSTDNRNNFLLINKGSKDSIREEMGVISPRGVAGIVVGVSENYACVMSVLHKNSRISAKIKKSNQLVNVIWQGIDYRHGTVTDIPSHILLSPGDTIVTSGFSLVFPEGIDIGTVKGQEKPPDKALGNAEMAFSTDFNNLLYVYVIRNRHKKEQQQLIDQFSDE
jgi:rod shape-determining protein MreC